LLNVDQRGVSGATTEGVHDPLMIQLDDVVRQLAAATGERILHEALYREAEAGKPEEALAANPELEMTMGASGATLAVQLMAKKSEIALELAQLKAEHGVNFPRIVEIERAQAAIEEQLKVQDANLLEGFRRSWRTAAERESLLREQLETVTEAGMKQNDVLQDRAVLEERVISERELCTRLERRIEEAGLSAGVRGSSLTEVDVAREPSRPVTPDVPLYLGITLVVGTWIAVALSLILDSIWPPNGAIRGAALIVILGAVAVGGAQPPMPSTSGLPSGVVRPPSQDAETNRKNVTREPTPIFNSLGVEGRVGVLESVGRAIGAPMSLPIQAGDSLDIVEFHVAEFHSVVRVSEGGTVQLPLVGEVSLLGMTESEAGRAIEKRLLDGGMLLHPQVTVLVTSAVGQDVSVLGEVARPGIYAYTIHHRLLDLISAASGLSPNAGRLVSIFHRDAPQKAHPVVLDPSGSGAAPNDGAVDHNPELQPGDTVQVSRAGLAYVIGDVVRPGGFAVDPAQGLTIVQALALAWGSTPNASVTKAILIRDQSGGRTLTTLNLRRMIRGQDPDMQVRDRDILFVPDSATKSFLNKTLESAIQSAIGVTIYAGLVYSQRF